MAKKKKKRYVKRAPLGRILGAIAGACYASGPSSGFGGTKLSAATMDALYGNFDKAGGRLKDMRFNPSEIGMGLLMVVAGAEISKANSKYAGIQGTIPFVNIKVRV